MSRFERVLVTGTAGFIGNHVALRLIQQGRHVVGVDNLNPYYDVSLKEARRERLLNNKNYTDNEIDITDRPALAKLLEQHRPQAVVHLAAQAGVRYSLDHPQSYVASNLDGFASVLEACRHHPVDHFIYASTSSVYGANRDMPFSEHRSANHPVSLYAATKRANELMAHSYSHLFGLPATGLRFFTVYGPWGRPDMALFKFTERMLSGKPIDIYNRGEMKRDFTFIDDLVETIVRLVDVPPLPDPQWSAETPDPATSGVAPWRILNIGNAEPVNLLRFVEVLESSLGREAKKNFLPMQPGDVTATHADMSEVEALVGKVPRTSIEVGVKRFVDWYLDVYQRELQ